MIYNLLKTKNNSLRADKTKQRGKNDEETTKVINDVELGNDNFICWKFGCVSAKRYDE